MSSLAQTVGIQLSRALDELGARPAKSTKPDTRSAKGTGKQDGDGLSDASRAHVEEMLKAGMGAVATCVETRIVTVEASVTELAGKNTELEDRVRVCEDSMARQVAEIAALRDALSKHEAACADRFALLENKHAEQASILDKIVVPGPSAPSTSTDSVTSAANEL